MRRRVCYFIPFLFFTCLTALPLQAVEVDWEPPVWLPKSWFSAFEADPRSAEERAESLWEKAKEAEMKGRERVALRRYRRLADKYTQSPYAPEALYRIGEIQASRKNYKRAYRAFDQLLAEHPDFGAFNDIIQRQYEIATAMVEGKTSRYFGVIPYKDRGTAIQFLNGIVENAPYNDYAPHALMRVAEIQREAERMNEAIATLDRLVSEYPENRLTPEAYLRIADAYASLAQGPEYDQGSTKRAMEYYEDFLLLYPDAEQVAQSEEGLAGMRDAFARSKLILGRYYYRYRDNDEAAAIFLNEAITLSPNSAAAVEAQEWLAKIESKSALATEAL